MDIKNYLLRFILILSTLLPQLASAKLKDVVSFQEYTQLAQDLSQKVNLFAEVWRQNPETRIYGGSTRDYLLWVKRQFKDVKTRAEAEQVMHHLRSRQVIELKEFLTPQSDIDLIGNLKAPLSADQFGIKSIDLHPSTYLAVVDANFMDEVHQGFLPAEKIQLSAKGFTTLKEFGNGVREIYEGQLTVHMTAPEVFKKTHWAQRGLNHQILLALRYLRAISNHAFSEYGQSTVNVNNLIQELDPESKKSVQEVIKRCLDGKELVPFLSQDLFSKWLNATIQKSFSTYTNRSVAFEMLKYFEIDKLQKIYSGIQPYNQYFTSRPKDKAAIAKLFKDHNVDASKLYRPVSHEFSDGYLYHGTTTQDTFRAILLQGVLSSSNGAGGAGIYGVAHNNIGAAIREGGSSDLLLKFKVRPDAKIIDITSGEGRELYRRLGLDYNEFAEKTGADILIYPYEYGEAFVVKNAAVLESAEGVNQSIMTFDKVAKQFSDEKSLEARYELLNNSQMSQFEVETLMKLNPSFGMDLAIRVTQDPSFFNTVDLDKAPGKYLNMPELLARAVLAKRISFEQMASLSPTFFFRGERMAQIYASLEKAPATPELQAAVIKFLTGQDQPDWNSAETVKHAISQIQSQTAGTHIAAASYFIKYLRISPEVMIAVIESSLPHWEAFIFSKAILPRKLPQLGANFIHELIEKHPKSHNALWQFFATPESHPFQNEFQLLTQVGQKAAVPFEIGKAMDNFKNVPMTQSPTANAPLCAKAFL